jgi:prenylcysteine oxidase/farnesylcysteine lyase
MRFTSTLLALLGLSDHEQQLRFSSPQHSLPSISSAPPRIAIVGGGAAGTSAAYFLAHLAQWNSSLKTQVTLFEQSDYIGGRSTTVLPPRDVDEDQVPVELGASIFVDANRNLVKAAKLFNLTLQPGMGGGELETDSLIGIWDGKEFVYTESRKGGYWDMFKLWWRSVRSRLPFHLAVR